MTQTADPPPDVIDLLTGITPGDRLDTLRRHRLQARTHAQQSYLALFEPQAPQPGRFSLADRQAVAAFVAGLHQQPDATAFYNAALAAEGARQARPGVPQAIAAEVVRGAARGPYGNYPPGPLSEEDTPGPAYRVSEAQRAVLGAPLSAALEHAHLLTLHPRDASPAALQALLDAGWRTTEIVTLSQLVAFLAFQIRVVAGLRALAAAPAHTGNQASSETTQA